jgi:hypothetical protein
MKYEKDILKIFKRLEEANFENETSSLEKEYQNEKERLNKEKMKKVRGLISPVEQFKIQRD